MKNTELKNKVKFIPKQSRIHYGGAVISEQEINALLETIKTSGGFNWTIGKKGEELEKILSKYTQQEYTILTNSGSSALLVGLLALHLPKGSRVILPATTFPTAYSSIIYAGYKPLVVDSKLETFNIDEKEFEKSLNKYNDIRAVIAVNIAGNIPNLSKIKGVANKHGIKVILDNCDGFGGLYNNKPVESLADVVATSFHAAHIITMGEGGAVFTSDLEVANRARQYRDWGREGSDDKPTELKELPTDYPKRYSYPVLGLNLKPLELQAAVGIVQFKKLKKFKAMRSRNFRLLNKIFSKYPDHFKVMKTESGAEPCWFSFPILVTGMTRKTLVDVLEKNNIETRPIFSGNILRHPIGKCESVGNCPNADEILKKGVFIGLSPRTTPEMIHFIGRVVDDLVQTI